jgi:hypothetical protein
MAIAEGAVLLLCFARLGVAVRRTSFAVEGALALVVGVLLVLRLSRRLRRSRVGGPFV